MGRGVKAKQNNPDSRFAYVLFLDLLYFFLYLFFKIRDTQRSLFGCYRDECVSMVKTFSPPSTEDHVKCMRASKWTLNQSSI